MSAMWVHVSLSDFGLSGTRGIDVLSAAYVLPSLQKIRIFAGDTSLRARSENERWVGKNQTEMKRRTGERIPASPSDVRPG
jgi:hypothetical protein